MRIITLMPKNPDSSKIVECFISIRDSDGYTYDSSFQTPFEKFSIELPLKENLYELNSGADIWIGLRDENKYFTTIIKNDLHITSKVIEVELQEIILTTKDKVSIDELRANNYQIDYTLNINDPYKKFKELEISEIYVEKDELKIPFQELAKELDELHKEGSYTYNVNFKLNNSMIFTYPITIEVTETAKELPKFKPIVVDYVAVIPLYANPIKPKYPLTLIASSNFKVDKVEFYLNQNLIFTTNHLGKVDLDISTANSFEENALEVKFYGTDLATNIKRVISRTLTFTPSDKLNLSLYHSYNSDKDTFTFGISGKENELDQIQTILWNVRYSSLVMQHIIGVGDINVDMLSDVIFEHMSDDEHLEMEIDFKQKGTFYVTAYVFDKAGNVHKLKDEVEVLDDNKSEGEYEVNQTIPVIIKANVDKTPVFDVYYIKDNILTKEKTVITKKLFGSIYSGSFVVNHNDCVYIVKVGNEITTFHIGKSNNILVLKAKNSTPPHYIFKDYDGNLIEEGDFIYDENSKIMYVTLPEDKHGIVQIGSNTYKKV